VLSEIFLSARYFIFFKYLGVFGKFLTIAPAPSRPGSLLPKTLVTYTQAGFCSPDKDPNVCSTNEATVNKLCFWDHLGNGCLVFVGTTKSRLCVTSVSSLGDRCPRDPLRGVFCVGDLLSCGVTSPSKGAFIYIFTQLCTGVCMSPTYVQRR